MIKFSKALVSLSLFVLLSLILSGCRAPGLLGQGPAQTFTKEGLSITLTSAFSEQELDTQTAYYVSQNAVVTTLKEEFSLLQKAGISTDGSLADYAQVVINNNQIDSRVLEEEGLTCFTYEKLVGEKNISYYATVFRDTTAYWLVQFGCETSQFEQLKPQFMEYAKTVTFTQN